MVTNLLHSKAGVLNHSNHSPEGANPKMTWRIQMEPAPAKAFSLEGVQIYSGDRQKASLLEMLSAGAEKWQRIFQMLDHLPASDC